MACGQVVAVALNVAGEAAVVQPEQAHHPVRDGAHRHQRADGQVARAEVRPRGPALEAFRQNGADVVAAEGHGAGHLVLRGLPDQLVEQRLELRPLPGLGRCRRHEGIGELRQRGGPLRYGTKAGECVEPRLQALQEFRQTAGEVDVATVHVVERERGAEETLPLLGHRHPEQNPVETRLPRVGGNPLELERAPVRGIEAPAHERAVHPFLQPVQIVVAEAETAAHRVPSREVQHLGRRDPGRGQLEHLGEDAHHGVGLAQRAVGQPDLERPLGVGRLALQTASAEGRLDQRREGLDVGAHHDDVAGLQRRIVLQQMEDGVAEYLDLAAAAVARMHTDAVVVTGE